MSAIPHADVCLDPLSPTRLLERTLRVHADRIGVVDRDTRVDVRPIRRGGRSARGRPAPSGDRARRSRRGPPPQLRDPPRRGLRDAAHRGAARLDQHAPRTGGDRLHPRALGRARAARRPRARRAARRRPARHRDARARRRGAPPRRRRAGRRHDVRELRRRRRGAAGPVRARGREQHPLHQLHVGDDRPAEGRDVQPSRRISQRARPDRHPPPRPGHDVPLDAAPLPLQRLVHALGGHRGRRQARLPPRNRPAGDLLADRLRGRDPLQRRADRAPHAEQRPRGLRASLRSADPRVHGRRPAVADPARADGEARDRDHPPLRPDRDVRAPRVLRDEGRVARARSRGPREGDVAAGRALRVRHAPARRRRADERRPRRRGHDGRGRDARQQRDARLLRGPRGHREGLRRRLVPLGRRRRHAPRRLHRAARPQQGHHHLGRREHLDDRGRERPSTSTPTCSRSR